MYLMQQAKFEAYGATGPNRVTRTHLRVPVRSDVISALPQRPLLADSGQANFGDAELHIRESWH